MKAEKTDDRTKRRLKEMTHSQINPLKRGGI